MVEARMLAAAAVAAALAAAVPRAAFGAGFDLPALCALRGAVAGGDARFRESRTSPALKAPLVREGTLEYRRPDHVEMIVESPRPEHIVVDGGRMTIDSARGRRELVLADEPALLAWTESLRATLAGDCPALLRHFDAALDGSVDDWTLVLRPRDAALRALVARVTIGGRRDAVLRVGVEEAGGDASRMDIAPASSGSP